MAPFNSFDYEVMSELLARSRDMLGLTFPNPVTASAIVKNKKIISIGVHQGPGEDHAEVVALKKAGNEAHGADLYVNLEPCSHKGKTPPCTQAIINSGIKRVVYAIEDPNPKVRQHPAKDILNEQGILVETGLMEKEAFELNEVFLKTILTGLPFVTLKIGLSLDGKIAALPYQKTQITSEESLKYVHKLRREVDAIIVGIDTIIADDPLLTVRFGYLTKGFRPPLRVVLDSNGRLPLDSKILKDDLVENTIVFVSELISQEKYDTLSSKVTTIKVKLSKKGLEWVEILRVLYDLGCYSILVEGGQRITTSIVQSGFVDKLMLFVAPKTIGEDGLSFFIDSQLELFGDDYSLEDMKVLSVGQDALVQGYLTKD